VPGNGRIIVRGGCEVNGLARASLCFVLLLSTALAPACGGDERRADRLYREAATLIEKGEIDEAVKRLERLVREFRDTEAGKKAKSEIVLYRGLASAVDMYPERRAAESMIRTARAIERYHARKRAWPEALTDLVPAEFAVVPADPWGQPLRYERKPGGRGYRLSCYGADGTRGGVDQDADILVEDGEFKEGGLH
jgi:hypothetical protein